MKSEWSQRTLHKHNKEFCALRSEAELCKLLKKESYQLHLYGQVPLYNTFTVPKRAGGNRWIEDPYPPLKQIQRKLNDHLQGVYYFVRTSAAYGFLVNARDDPSPRTIVTNARRHTGKKYLLNIDLQDFFHQVKTEKVIEIFERPPFRFPHRLANTLSQLTTFRGRLPMGAPTSPILSNFATIGLDEELTAFAKTIQARFTRYADDLVFSSNDPIVEEEVEQIRAIITSHHFIINENKVKLYGENQPGEVTGLRVGQRVDLPEEYLPLLNKEIEKLRHVMEVDRRFNTLQSTQRLNQLKQMIRGHIAFAAMVLGEKNTVIKNLRDRFEQALDPPDDFMSASWLDFNYL